ncbi:hypothetical protein [Bradyrhizobium elkanii]|uniref:hypothetical protein n=1 Tax=Bradyrhizobium elkanii TaxID=29448 RepID=UPI0022274CAE|nr:hypothetical protein [Bradyrhizobium elkanii]
MVEFDEKGGKLHGSGDYPIAHNGLVAGSSPAGPTNIINGLLRSRFLRRNRRTRNVQLSFVHEDDSRCTSRSCDFPRSKCNAGYITHIAITCVFEP